MASVAGCSVDPAPVAAGGVIGAGVGAGTGAIIGAAISNGDVAASTLLGTAIGLPVGLIIGAAYDYYSADSVRERKMDQVRANQEELFARQREIDRMREEIRNDAPTELPDESLREHQYNGPTLGNYYR